MKSSEKSKVQHASDALKQPDIQKPRFTAVYEIAGGALSTYQNYAVDADAFVSELRGLKPVTKLTELSVTQLEGRYLFIQSRIDVTSYNERLSRWN
jgi:hypothetical protein